MWSFATVGERERRQSEESERMGRDEKRRERNEN